ncbi:hypothetical protein V6N11_012890 [Hibiscus sabdariffa]|uniref:Uncharacterized protein n=2 Tax=Hibiscus sabdariffa TaxID=183260 RepID=A0ABR2C084_9ROSI
MLLLRSLMRCTASLFFPGILVAFRIVSSVVYALARECRSNPIPFYWVEEAPTATTDGSELDGRRLTQSTSPSFRW